MIASSIVACAERAPPLPPIDAAPRPRIDAAIPDAAIGPRRLDGGPRLPPADEEIVLPYLGEPVMRELDVIGEVGALDVFFSIDTTGSFTGEIDNLQAQLRSVVLPALHIRVDDVAVGVGRFEDFPRPPFGAPTDVPFRLTSPITTSESRVASAVAALDQPIGNGGDIPEAGAEALYQIATGEGRTDGTIRAYDGRAAFGGGTLGGVGFREGSLRVVVHVTDAPSHGADDYGSAYPGTHDLDDAIAALRERAILAIGIASGEIARPHLEVLATGTGAVAAGEGGLCATGVDGAPRAAVGGRCPLVFDVRADGSGLSETVVDAITDLLATVRYEEVWAESDDALGFVQTLAALEAEPPPGAPAPTRADRRPAGDGIDDTFLEVRPGTRLSFRALLRNETIRPADYDQFFQLTLRVMGDGVILARRTLRVVVPRGRLDAGVARDGGHDGGADAGDDAGNDPAPDAAALDGGADAGDLDGS